jgi:hypothetical protein
VALFVCNLKRNTKKEERAMKETRKGNRYATNQGGVIKAPNTVKNSPKSTVVKSNDLRNGKSK